MTGRVRCVMALTGVFAWATCAFAQTPQTERQIYESACAACHGSDGRGSPAVAADYPLVPPDFTDCRFASREASADWFAVAHQGGPARGFDRMMPAFGEALGNDDLTRAVAHVRTFCADDAWPRGELNLPRALVTGKAYPEDEAVLTVVAEDGAVTSTFIYERRFGARNQIELIVPLAFSEQATPAGAITTGVLTATRYAKDNRLLPRGFEKRAAPADVAVHGAALDDPDFSGGEDRVRYSIGIAGTGGPLLVETLLWYQPIAYRWVENLRTYKAAEPQRFVGYFDEMSPASALMLTREARSITD